MDLKFASNAKAIGFALVMIGSLVLAVMAAGLGNQYWSSPFIALVVMFFLGSFPTQGADNQFEWIYVMFLVASGALLMFTSEQVYWTTPLLVGVLLNLFNDGLVIKISR